MNLMFWSIQFCSLSSDLQLQSARSRSASFCICMSCVGSCSTRCSQEGFYWGNGKMLLCWTHRGWIFQLALFSRSAKNFHQSNEPISQQQGPYKYWKQNLVCIKLEMWRGCGEGNISPEGGMELLPLTTDSPDDCGNDSSLRTLRVVS